jgi:hypothetical protein
MHLPILIPFVLMHLFRVLPPPRIVRRSQVRTDFIEVLDAIDGVRKPKDGSGAGAGASGAGREQNVYRQIFDRLKVRSAHRRVDKMGTKPNLGDYSVTIVQSNNTRSWPSIRDMVSVFCKIM